MVLQEKINSNSKTFNFISKYSEKMGDKTNVEEEYTIFINQIVSIYKERSTRN